MLTWALAKDLELLWSLRLAQDAHQPLVALLQAAKYGPAGRHYYQQTVQRLSATQLRDMLTHVERVIAVIAPSTATVPGRLQTLSLGISWQHVTAFYLAATTLKKRMLIPLRSML